MIGREEYSFGYGKKYCECWFHRVWIVGNDYIHDHWYAPTLGLDGVE